MKIDENKPTANQVTCEKDRQNRREFFNGLGKWSMIVIAAISFLRGSGTAARARLEESQGPEQEPERPAWTASDYGSDKRLKVTKKPPPHKDYNKSTGGPGGGYSRDWINYGHTDYWK